MDCAVKLHLHKDMVQCALQHVLLTAMVLLVDAFLFWAGHQKGHGRGSAGSDLVVRCG